MNKYKIGDRVYWLSEKKKLIITNVRPNALCKYSCVCSDGSTWNWFRPNELKPIITVKAQLGNDC